MEKKWTNKLNEHEYACNNNKYIYNIEWSTFEWKKMGKIANNCKLFTMKMNKQTNKPANSTQPNEKKKKNVERNETRRKIVIMSGRADVVSVCVSVSARAVRVLNCVLCCSAHHPKPSK